MVNYRWSSDLVVAVVTLVLASVCALPAAQKCYQRCLPKWRQYQSISDHYEDKDGSATEESQSAYSDFVSRLVLLLCSIAGIAVSIVFVVFTHLDVRTRCASHRVECDYQDNTILLDQCLVLPIWVLIGFQVVVLYMNNSSTQRFRLGIYGASASIILSISLAVQAILWRFKEHSPPASKFHYALASAQLVLAVLLAVAFVSIPRRPEVFRDGQKVDRQYTASFLNRLTFGWISPLLAVAAKKKTLDQTDLPVVSDDTRARTLRQRFEDAGVQDKLWKNIFWSHSSAFFLQWILQIVQAFANFITQIALYFALRSLEEHDAGQDTKLQLWLLVAALGIADFICNWVENLLYYISFLKLGTPVYEQVSTIVFGKAMRKKDVKGVSGSTDTNTADENIVVNKGSGGKDEDTVIDDGAEDEVAKTKQSTINLIGVDGKRIADFASYNSMILGAVLKLTIAICFLVTLLGWIPMLSGFAAFFALMPLNWWVTSNYTHAQDVLMKLRDTKMGVVTEALQGIRQIKFSALEDEWHNKIGKARGKELNTLWRVFSFDVGLLSIWIFGPVALSAISLTVYALIHKQLSASVAFTTISVFEAIEVTLAVLPELITDLLDALVSSRRIQEYLNSPDQEDSIQTGENIAFHGATVAWPSDGRASQDDAFTLRGLDLVFPEAELSVISGKTGSGKSLLLSSIIGEADVLSGIVEVPQAPSSSERYDHKANKSNWYIKTAIAYVAQIPWIENAPIRENILFGLPFDENRYQEVLRVSALLKDLEMLQDGDLTDIGANGINLSGGQKWRVSFARALYSRAGILILDDIFSAVDAHVGKHLFEEALTGNLGKGRTRILVTHHVALCLPKTKYSVLLENGAVLHAGSTDELRRNGLLKEILAYDIEEQQAEEVRLERTKSRNVDDGGGLQKILSRHSTRSRGMSNASDGSPRLNRAKSHISEERAKGDSPKKFTEEEKRERGAIKLSIYRAYIDACGGFSYWSFILLVFVAGAAVYLARSYWISVWTRSYKTESSSPIFLLRQPTDTLYRLSSELKLVRIDDDLSYYLGVYLAIAIGSWLLGTLKYFCVYLASIRASKKLFERLCYAILRAPLRFLDTTPMGRILNRFTADFNNIDSKISSDLAFMIHSGVLAIAVIVAGVFVSPFMLLAAVILLLVCLWFALRYLAAAREVKRLESNAKSPVFEQFGSVLSGIGTIRAFGKAEAYIQRMDSRIDTHCQAYFHLFLLQRWMSFRVALVGSVFLTAMGALIVGLPQVDASLAGFALSFSLQLSEAIIWLLRQYSNVELDMNAIERVVEYSNMRIEDQGGSKPPAAWPTKGEIEVNDLVVAYAPDLNPVLRGLTFTVRENERVGVVGRTGAGKSSLTLALFRFLEAQSGSIHIDGVDISKIRLLDLRSRLAIIPQDPVLFSGTIRTNLDAFDQHSDSELREALARVHLITSPSAVQSGTATPMRPTTSEGDSTTNKNLFTSLTSKISEGGLNLSQGQRQLLCLARAIISHPKIMVLDEATSSVDMDTDALIQRSIREEFADSTLIVIAHRLSTIADFDRILVLGEGKVLEFDTPAALMKKEAGVFRSMVEESGERKELEAIINGVLNEVEGEEGSSNEVTVRRGRANEETIEETMEETVEERREYTNDDDDEEGFSVL